MTKHPNIPANYNTVMPYLILKKADTFIAFTQKVFGARLSERVMRDENTIMHAEVMIGESTIMFAEATDQFHESLASLFVYVENVDEAYHKALENGASEVTPLSDQEYGRSGGVKDPCGNIWWITSIKK